MQYAELHAHSYYSLMDGVPSPEEYIIRAKELGMTHMALTDHGVVSGHREFQVAAEKHGITPLLGVEAYISETDRFDRRTKASRSDGTQTYNHMGLIAINEEGLKNLNAMSEKAWSEGFYSKPRIDIELLEEYSDGIVSLSGCLNGLICKALERGSKTAAEQWTQELKRIFGERFFIEVMSHNPPEINAALLGLADRYGVKAVVTSDCHHARKEDLWIQEAMLILSTNPKPAHDIDFNKSQKMDFIERYNYLYPDRKMTFQDFNLHLNSIEEHMAGLEKQGIGHELISNTMIVAEMVEGYPYYEALDLLPRPKTDADTLLRKKAFAGLKKRGKDKDQEYIDRLEEELEVILNKDFSTYFLILENTLTWARGQGIRVGPGRGSGAGSLLNYCLWITNVDPIEHNLLFFRFLDPSRDDYPDVDVDIEDARRSEVKDYMRRKFKHVASIATFGLFQGKGTVRDASRVFRIPLGEVNKALKGADYPEKSDFFEEWGKSDNGKEYIKKYPEVVRLAKAMHGKIRSQGMHAGGIVISKEPISNYAPMQTAKDASDPLGGRIPLVALDMEQAAEVGLIKYDLLGLKALTIISDTIASVKERTGVEIDIDTIPMDDKRVFDMLSNGFTKGVFQAEAAPYTHLLLRMGGVSTFDELVASNALVRPGAMKSSAGQSYIDRKAGTEMIEYAHQDTHWFTKDTYGVVLYQEQVMLMMTELAGMSMGDANKVRKIIGKKKDVSEFEAYKSKFIDGASKKVPEKVAARLWDDFEAHAGYSFNLSHSVAYSILSYQTAWLKVNYPVDFIMSILKNEGDKDKRLDYLIEAKRMGIRIKLPDVNASGLGFEIQSDANGDFIRFGLSNIKYISDKIGGRIMEHRPFKNYEHLKEVVLTKGSGLNTRVLQSLNAIGGATFEDNPKTGNERDNFFEYLSIPAFQSQDLPPAMKMQFRPLDEYTQDEAFVCLGMVRGIKTGPGWARVEMVDETGAAGVFAGEHTPIEQGQMYAFLIANNRIARFVKVDELINDQGGTFQEFLEETSFPDVPEGMLKVVSFNSRTTKAGKKMADIVFCNEHKELTPALVFPKEFMKAYSKCKEGAVVDVQLSQTDDGTYFVNNIL